MSEKKYLVPADMLRATAGCGWHRDDCERILRIGLRWIAENPIVPTPEQALAMSVTKPVLDSFDNWELVRWGACEWQRRMFLASEPEVRQFVVDIAHSFQGVTLTESEFRYLMDFVDTHGVDRAKVVCRGRESK